MRFSLFKNTVLLFVLIAVSCGSKSEGRNVKNTDDNDGKVEEIVVGANRTSSYLKELRGKRIGIVANQTSVIFHSEQTTFTHLVDSLVSLNINIRKVFAPEHGFRGKADAGELVKDGVDTKTNIPIISLYGENKKPKPEQLSDLDLVIFDIQDVGARFYTYISTLHYVMEACAEAGITVLILDRPNPNGHFVDGPILELEHQSFVGMHPIPVVHGMTIGEYAKMINGEGWLASQKTCDLKVIEMSNYNHKTTYSLPIKPSPNLPNDTAINLYPSLCFFEGTSVSAGRGTNAQFQVYGSPYLDKAIFSFEFIPKPNEGAKYPKHEGKVCFGLDLQNSELLNHLDLSHLIRAYKNSSDQEKFFIPFFTKLAGTKNLQRQIENGIPEEEIRSSWTEDLIAFQKIREKYLIYP